MKWASMSGSRRVRRWLLEVQDRLPKGTNDVCTAEQHPAGRPGGKALAVPLEVTATELPNHVTDPDAR
jgi:hypothetical protein